MAAARVRVDGHVLLGAGEWAAPCYGAQVVAEYRRIEGVPEGE